MIDDDLGDSHLSLAGAHGPGMTGEDREGKWPRVAHHRKAHPRYQFYYVENIIYHKDRSAGSSTSCGTFHIPMMRNLLLTMERRAEPSYERYPTVMICYKYSVVQ